MNYRTKTKKSIPKKVLKVALLSPIILILLFLILMSVKYSPTYVYRTITMNVADVYDYKNFENRKIKGAANTFHFEEKFEEAYIESLFDERVSNTGFN